MVVSVSELTNEEPARAIFPVTWAVNMPNKIMNAEVSTKPATQLNKKPAGPSLIKKALKLNGASVRVLTAIAVPQLQGLKQCN
jgi:hypothetical protein